MVNQLAQPVNHPVDSCAMYRRLIQLVFGHVLAYLHRHPSQLILIAVEHAVSEQYDRCATDCQELQNPPEASSVGSLIAIAAGSLNYPVNDFLIVCFAKKLLSVCVQECSQSLSYWLNIRLHILTTWLLIIPK